MPPRHLALVVCLVLPGLACARAGDLAWIARKPMPTPRRALALASLGDRIVAVGGFDGTNLLGTVEIYDPRTDAWTAAAPMPTPRAGLALAAFNGKLYAIGG